MKAQCPRCGSWNTEGPDRVLVTSSGMVGSRDSLGWGLAGFLFGVASLVATFALPVAASTRGWDLLFALVVTGLGVWGLVRYSVLRQGKVQHAYYCKKCENSWRV